MSSIMSHQLIKLRWLLQQGGGHLGLGSSRNFSFLPLPSITGLLDRLTKCQTDVALQIGNHGIVPTCMSSSTGARLVSTSCGAGGKGLLASEYKGTSDLMYSSPKKEATSLSGKYDNPHSQRLLAARTTDEILTVLESEADMMDILTVSVAVDVLFDALRNDVLNTKTKHQLLTSVGMQKLCKQLRRRSPHMDAGDIINGVKLLSLLSAPGSHQTLQILLKLLTKHANSMDLQQIMYTQFLLDKLDADSKSPLSKALEFALPVVFESKLYTELDRNDMQTITDYLHYSSKCNLSEKTLNFLVEVALQHADRLSHYSAKSILWSLCDAKYDNMLHAPLVAACYKKLTQKINDMKLMELSTTVSKVARRYSRRAPYFYNESFIDAYCQRVINSDVDPVETLWAIKSTSLLRHVNIDFVDRMGEIIASNPSHILNNDNMYMFFIKGISTLNYKPEKWPAFSSILLEHPALTKSFGTSEISLANDFLALEMFPDEMIRRLFSAEGLDILEDHQRRHHPIYLLLLYNSVKVLYPKYRGPLPPITMVENWKELARAANANKQYPLKTALQTGLGGESYVINGLFHDGLHIDHGIVMRKGGYPVAVNSQSDSQSDCLSSITKPPESVMVLVKVFTDELYANNTRRLKGLGALELRILENLGHPIVAVDLNQWMELPDHEKIPYLMHKIREKMEPLQWNQNWGDVIPP